MVNIYIQGQLIDQFDDESVEVVSQVLDISDISKVKGDYSQTFTVPASKKNNKIFKHWYNASIDLGFDARTKADGKIDINGIPFKSGKFLLHKAQIDNGIITSYTINFFGNVTDLKDVLGKDELTDLDLSAYDHDWTDDDVLDKLKVNETDPYPAVIYTLSSKKRFYYDSSYNSPLTFQEAQEQQFSNNALNIAYKGDSDYADYDDSSSANFAFGVPWRDILPSLRVDKILEAIENKYNITFTRDFFGTSNFNKLYMLLSSSEGGVVEGIEGRDINWYSTAENAGSNNTYVDPTTETATFVVTDGTELRISINAQTYENEQVNNVSLRLNVNGEYVQSVSGSTSSLDSGDIPFQSEEWVYINDTGSTQTITAFYDLVNIDGNCDFEWIQTLGSSPSRTTLGRRSFVGTASIKRNLPKIKTIDFLSGLFKMFKLVVVPQEDGSLYINTTNNYYMQGKEYNVSKYVDRSSLEVSRGDLISEISMKYKESETALAKQFRLNNGRGYGDAIVGLTDDDDNPLDGESIDFELPFEQVVYERLSDQGTGEITKIHSLGIHSAETPHEPIKPEAILHYANGKANLVKPILFRMQSGGFPNMFEEVTEPIYLPTHHIDLHNPFASLVFEKEFSTWDGAIINNTLYSKNYENYISSAFDIGRRTYSYTAKLPVIISANLQLNDVLVIDGKRLRINKHSYNLLTGLSKLELINKLDTSLQPFNGAPPKLYVDANAQTFSFALDFADEYTITETDLGNGTGWTLPSTSFDSERGIDRHNTFNIQVSKRVTTGTYRRVQINFTRNGDTTTMIVLQAPRET